VGHELWTLFASTPRGLEALLAEELRTLGAENVREARAGVSFEGDRTLAYRVCLWSRVAGRVLMKLADFPAETPEALYAGVQQIDWATHVMPEGTLSVDGASVQSTITHTHFAALKVKDAIVDQFRDRLGVRPSVDTMHPDLRVNVYLFRDRATLNIDLSGDSLHRRGYRAEGGGEAPLKEHLAAALLYKTRWPKIAKEGGALLDPMCGSGTLVIEGAWMAGDVAPGLFRPHFGFENWLQHDAFVWRDLINEAHQRREQGLKNLPPIVGSDRDNKMLALAQENVARARLDGVVTLEPCDVADMQSPGDIPGLLITNPPYGERMADVAAVRHLYDQIGQVLRDRFSGWMAAFFTGRPDLAPALKLKPRRTYEFFNGTIPCKLMVYKLGQKKEQSHIWT
jgi:23S rRNA (guanine2445-N2)-methyltransferase / 23S rRNA (guanine2069-N7)-methyltransferase